MPVLFDFVPTLFHTSLLDQHHSRYNHDTESWSADAAPLNCPRTSVCLAAMDGHQYVTGGHDGTTAINAGERECKLSKVFSLRICKENKHLSGFSFILPTMWYNRLYNILLVKKEH